MKHLKRHINVAINKEYMEIQKYAFRKYKIKSVENNHTHLSPEELGKIESLELGDGSLNWKRPKMLSSFVVMRDYDILTSPTYPLKT